MLLDIEWKRILVALREPHAIESLPIPQSAYTFGAVNPHVREWISRRIQSMCSSGEAEMVVEEKSNLTGSRSKNVFAGQFRLTPKGIGVLKRMNEEEEKADKTY